MSNRQFTVEDLHRILVDRAGEAEGVTLGPETVDLSFSDLGYESIALLETGGAIEREFAIALSDDELLEADTPRVLIDAVNARLGAGLKA
jgi:act minimal PKS acyl carrier protein